MPFRNRPLIIYCFSTLLTQNGKGTGTLVWNCCTSITEHILKLDDLICLQVLFLELNSQFSCLLLKEKNNLAFIYLKESWLDDQDACVFNPK